MSSKKLTFKGDKSKTKSKKRKRDDGDAQKQRHDDLDWVLPDKPEHITGPSFIFHPSNPPICIAFDQQRARITLPALQHDSSSPLLDLIPTEVSHVWVVTSIAGTQTINLRTPDGKFISADKHGIVSANREARGPQEEWSPVILEEGMVAFQNMYDKFLGLDEVAGGSLSLRADADAVGFHEKWWVKVQYGHKSKVAEQERKREGLLDENPNIDEAATNRVYHTWGANRSVVSGESTRDLKKARKDGRLAEALLDRRAKLKSDRFC